MYQPAHFRVDDPATLHDFIAAHPLGLLVSVDGGGPVVDPLPFLLDRASGKNGALRAHLARANPHWKLMQASGQAFVVFQAAGHYISPSWYPSKAEHGRVVPTWNYTLVEVRGKVRICDDRDWVLQQVTELTQAHEKGRAKIWRVEDAPEAFVEAQLRAIVGFEIEIESMSGKFKLSQNRPQADQAGVVAALDGEGDGMAAAVATQMRASGIGT